MPAWEAGKLGGVSQVGDRQKMKHDTSSLKAAERAVLPLCHVPVLYLSHAYLKRKILCISLNSTGAGTYFLCILKGKKNRMRGRAGRQAG